MLVRYYGHVGVASGYGQAANETCMAILSAGIDLEISTDGKQLRHPYLPLARCIRNEVDLSPEPDAVIVHTLPLDCGRLLTAVASSQSRRYHAWGSKCRTIAYTTWEGFGPISGEVEASLAAFDDVWVPSKATAAWFAGSSGGRVAVVPHAFDPAMGGRAQAPCPSCGDYHVLGQHAPGQTVITPDGPGTVTEWSQRNGPLTVRVELDGSNSPVRPAGVLRTGTARWNYDPCQFKEPPRSQPYRFYYIGAWVARKNVEGVVKAYLRSFGPTENVELVIHSAGAADSACSIAQMSTGLQVEQMPKIKFSNHRASDEYVREIHRQCDCFVTATRGEAWNIPAFDAMMTGKHVIAPGSMGSDEFLDGTSADLYRGAIVPAGGEVKIAVDPMAPAGHVSATYWGTQGLTVRSEWIEPDITMLSLLMRRAYVENKTSIRVPYDPSARFGRAAVGERIAALLKEGAK